MVFLLGFLFPNFSAEWRVGLCETPCTFTQTDLENIENEA